MRLASARVCSMTSARKVARRAGSQPIFSSGHWGATTENRSRPKRGNSLGGPLIFTLSSSVPDSPLPCRKRSSGWPAVPPFASKIRYRYIGSPPGAFSIRRKRETLGGGGWDSMHRMRGLSLRRREPSPTRSVHGDHFNLLRLSFAGAVLFSHCFELIDRGRIHEPLDRLFHTVT